MTKISKIESLSFPRQNKPQCNSTAKTKQQDCIQKVKTFEIPHDKFGIYFTGNCEKDEQSIPDDTYFIRLKTYGRNKKWAEKMNALTRDISDMMSKNEDFEDILATIETKIADINSEPGCLNLFGKTRQGTKTFNMLASGRGAEYRNKYMETIEYDTLDGVINPQPTERFKDAEVCEIHMNGGYGIYTSTPVVIRHDFPNRKNDSNIKYIKQVYEELKEKECLTEDEINQAAATIQWLFAQGTPYQRGSDSIANIFTRSLYHSYNMSVSPLKVGRSCDFEAFYRDLDEYIKIYPDLFRVRPHKITD